MPDFQSSALLSQNSRDIFFSPNGDRTGTVVLTSAEYYNFIYWKSKKNPFNFTESIEFYFFIAEKSNIFLEILHRSGDRWEYSYIYPEVYGFINLKQTS